MRCFCSACIHCSEQHCPYCVHSNRYHLTSWRDFLPIGPFVSLPPSVSVCVVRHQFSNDVLVWACPLCTDMLQYNATGQVWGSQPVCRPASWPLLSALSDRQRNPLIRAFQFFQCLLDAAQRTLCNNPFIKCSWLTWQEEPRFSRHTKKIYSNLLLWIVAPLTFISVTENSHD